MLNAFVFYAQYGVEIHSTILMHIDVPIFHVENFNEAIMIGIRDL